MSQVAIISNSQSYMIMTIKEKMEASGVSCVFSKAEVNDISRISSEVIAYLIYLDEDLADNRQTITYIKDRVAEKDIAVFICGNPLEAAEVENALPKHITKKSFIRPINVAEVVANIDEYVKSGGAGAKKKILVIDDSGAYLRNVKAWLEDRYQIVLANSGMMGIKYMSTNRPDLVLLDYEMPVCDGRQVLEMIRAESEFADIPVIFLTSKDDKESVIKVMELRPQGYLLKTLAPNEIVKQVDDFFMKQKAKG